MKLRNTASTFVLALSVACAVPPPPPPLPPAQSPAFTAPEGVTVPVGTVFMVRMYEGVDTKRHREGHRWTATLEADLLVDSTEVAPRGSVVYGVVSDANSSGRLAGRSSLTLRPTDLMIGSRMYPIVTGEIQAVAASNTAGKTVGRTARAAAVGGLIDGSDGARTGAKVGLGASLLSDDGQIRVKSGTLLEFPLAAPLSF